NNTGANNTGVKPVDFSDTIKEDLATAGDKETDDPLTQGSDTTSDTPSGITATSDTTSNAAKDEALAEIRAMRNQITTPQATQASWSGGQNAPSPQQSGENPGMQAMQQYQQGELMRQMVQGANGNNPAAHESRLSAEDRQYLRDRDRAEHAKANAGATAAAPGTPGQATQAGVSATPTTPPPPV
ncbi:hypothetical protein ACLMAL_39720, partial [Nocardia sp. CWNU-33]|uniref:hypothetical protein n=1 Tax=Nocardia sp. CWNU-33 TaxID=3392117 RepID=UPI00398E6373